MESAASLCSSDLECLGRLECLAEAESLTRRRIAELEAKEEALMRALAQADQVAPADEELRRAKDQADEALRQLEECRAELTRYFVVVVVVLGFEGVCSFVYRVEVYERSASIGCSSDKQQGSRRF